MAANRGSVRAHGRPGRLGSLGATLWALLVAALADGLLRGMTGR